MTFMIWLLCTVATGCLAVRRHRSVGAWVLLGVFLGPIAVIAILCLPQSEDLGKGPITEKDVEKMMLRKYKPKKKEE